MIDFQLKSHTIKGKNITMRVYEKGFTLFINHPHGYDTSVIVDGGLYKEIINELNREVVAELRKDAWERLGNIKVILRDDKEVMLKELATFKLRFDELFGCEKPMKDKTDVEICRSYVSKSVVGSQNLKEQEGK